jgi:ATP-dependent DNA helicase RecG
MRVSTVAAVPQALRAPVSERAKLLLALTEDQWFDRKSARINAKDLGQHLSALANAEGGTLVLGLAKGAVEGCDRYPDQVNALRQAAIDFTIPPVRIESSLIECVREDGTPDHLLLVEVSASNQVHTTQDDTAYLRVGDESRKLTFTQRQELYYDKSQAHFDSSPVSAVSLADLDAELVEQFADRLQVTDVTHTLRSLGLLTRDGEVTAAAYLLFAEAPQDEFPEAYVRVLRYRGTERGTGVRQGLTDDIRCEGAIPVMLDRAREAVQELQPARRALAGSGRFERHGLIPEDAWLEGIVNAVIHRSYSIGGDHIRVEIFDDRIDIYSPGRFPGITRPLPDPRKIVRFARNPRIAKTCSVLAFGQELGEGIRRIFDEMRLANLADPIYRETPASVHLQLEAVHVDASVMAQMPAEASQVMAALRSQGGLSTGDIAEAIGRSRPATITLLKRMQAAELIDWVGKASKDPRAYWRIHSE